MWILIISLIALGVVAAVTEMFRKRHQPQRSVEEERPATSLSRSEAASIPQTCCGQHAICERDSLLAAVSQKIEYYDDEELDRYAGQPSDSYTPEQTDKFRDVFYTMREEDVAGWVRSLQLRGIALPDNIKDEVLLVVGEQRH